MHYTEKISRNKESDNLKPDSKRSNRYSQRRTPPPYGIPFVDNAVQRVGNKTGMPDQLKSGIESLSGMDMSDVKVHFNSSRPAQLKAVAYAQGNQIHIGPRQEKHLPHEAWHVAQQKQGRVNPTMQTNSGMQVNDDPALEKEADEMGGRANQAISHRATPSDLQNSSSRSFVPVVQRQPEDALARIQPIKNPEIQKIYERILVTLKNARSLSMVPYSQHANTKDAIRLSLLADINLLTSLVNEQISKSNFITLWNDGLQRGSFLFITQALAKRKSVVAPESTELSMDFEMNPPTSKKPLVATPQPSVPPPSYIMDDRLWNAIDKWFNRPLTEKSMTPDKKLNKLQSQSNLLSSSLPEDFWVALKLLFVHTATFAPVERQGRDMTNQGTGTYYRTSENVVKDLVKTLLLKQVQEHFPGMSTKGKTIRTHNDPLMASLQESGALSSNLKTMDKFHLGNEGQMTFGMYKSAQGSHTGSLGFPTNAIKSLRTLERLKGTRPPAKFEKADNEMQVLIGKVNPELLKSQHEGNYHDFLLSNRALLIQQTTQWMVAQKPLGGAHIQAIQSGDHPSIIIYHPNYVDGTNEKEWRDAFLEEFNKAATALGYATRLNRRGSFGFLYPTVSSVGGPVRIWPGLVPASIFQSIMRHTIVAVYNRMNPNAPALLKVEANDTAKGNIVNEGGPLLHQEALRTAVKHTFGVMGQVQNRPSDKDVYKWVLNRLHRNLLKAQYLLMDTAWLKTQGGKETHYLKSTLVIENLMEYTYMLQALVREGNKPSHDPYPQHVANALLPSTTTSSSPQTASTKSIEIFYLDSGMQAIVAANLLAKAQVATTGKSQSAMQTLDANTYFEYASIHKGNLQLAPFDHTKPGRPDIISADLNPVLTAPGAKKFDASAALQHYSESKGGGKTIPIIDITNSTLSKAAKLDLGKHYENFIVLESLTKHQQLGADKFTMGRLNVIGTPQFIALAKKLVGPIAHNAHDPLWMEHRLSMDQVFYGSDQSKTGSSQSKADASQPSGKQDLLSILLSQLPVFKALTHKEVRKNEAQGMLVAFTPPAQVRIFQNIERGIMDHRYRTNSCGFLSLDTTREILQHDLIQTIQTGTNPRLQRILQLVGDEIQNSVIHRENMLLSTQNLTRIILAHGRFNNAENNRAKEIRDAKAFLVQKVGEQYRGIEMNVNNAITYLQQYHTQNLMDGISKNLHILSLQNAQAEHTQASNNLNTTYHSPQLALDYLANNLLGTQQLGHNTARAWAIANNIELHIWTHAGGFFIQEISPQDVVPGNAVIHMLHTSGRTHFQELIPGRL